MDSVDRFRCSHLHFAEWTRGDQYADASNCHPVQVAWEFLRRNPEYQRDFESLVRPAIPQIADKIKDHFETSIRSETGAGAYGALVVRAEAASTAEAMVRLIRAAEIDDPLDYNVGICPEDPDRGSCVIGVGFRGDILASLEFPRRIGGFAAERWGFVGLPPAPEIDRVVEAVVGRVGARYAFEPIVGGVAQQGLTRGWRHLFLFKGVHKALGDGPVVRVRFDLSLDLDRQLAQAREYLLIEQQTAGLAGNAPQHRNRWNLYSIYLRILDAETDGAKPADMAPIIFPNLERESAIKRCQNGLHAARRLRDENWRHIYLSAAK